MARTFVTAADGDIDLVETGKEFFKRLTAKLEPHDALAEQVRGGNSAARAEWVWARRLHYGESMRKVGDEARRLRLTKATDAELWAKEFSWPQGLHAPRKFRQTAASGLRAVNDHVTAALCKVTRAMPDDPAAALDMLIPEEMRTDEIRARTALDALTDLQRRALPAIAAAIEEGSSMLLGGPTGCGKTFLAQVAAVCVARRRHRKAIIAVPLKTLVRGIYEDVTAWVRQAGLEDEFRVLPGSRDYPEFDDDLARGQFDVAVVIYEKLNAYMAMGLAPLDDCGLLVIDELQQLDDEDRGGKIESLIAAVRHRHTVPIMGLSSALHEDTWEHLSTWLGVSEGNRVLSTVRPVPLDVSVTNGVETLSRHGLAQDLGANAAGRDPERRTPSGVRKQALAMKEAPSRRSLKIRDDMGRLSVAAAFACLKQIEFDASDNAQILIFTRNRDTAAQIAEDLRSALKDAEQTRPAFLSGRGAGGTRSPNPWISGRYVIAPTDPGSIATAEARYGEVLRSSLGRFRDQLIEAVRTGVGYHTAEVPRLIQQELEREYRNRNVRVLVSTKTLAIGVNLPVDIVIVANMTTHGKTRDGGGQDQTGDGLRLVTVGELRNMIGRAGRLGLSDRGLALITTEHWPSMKGLSDDDRGLVKDPDQIWSHYIQPHDFNTQLRSAMYEQTDTAAWLVLQTLVSDDYYRTHAFSTDELDAYISDLMGKTFAAVPQSAPAPVEAVRDQIVARRLMSPITDVSWRVSGLGAALAKSGLPLSETTTLTRVAEVIEDGCGTLEILYRLALGEHVSRFQHIKVRKPYDDRHALAELARRVVSLVRVYAVDTFEQRRQADEHLAATFRTPARSDRELANAAVMLGDRIHEVMAQPENMTEREINAMLRAVIAWEWSLGTAYTAIETRVVDVCTITASSHRGNRFITRPYLPNISIAGVEALTEQMSYVLAAVRELTPLTGNQVERQRVQRLSAALEQGLPSWLTPLSRLKMLALDRERLTKVAHRHPDFEETKQILQWRTVKTASGATAVQIVWSSRRGSRSIEHLGSAHDEAELAALKAAAAERLAANQAVLDLAVSPLAGSEPLPITSSQMSHLWEGLCSAYRILGFESVSKGDTVFRDLVLARIIEPSSKVDAERVLTEVGVEPASYATVKRRLPTYAKPQWRQSLAAASARRAGLGPASLVLFDVSTLYFETDAGDGFREPGFSKERRLEPQITLGLLTDVCGFPLTVQAFEGNRAETATMLPVINAFKAAHQLSDVTVVADAGMVSEANQVALQAAGLTYILGARIPFLPDVVREWRDNHTDEAIPDGLVLTQPWPATSSEKARGIPDRVVHYQFRHDRARRTLRGIESPWFRRRLGLLDFDQGLVAPLGIVERGFELGRR